MSEEPVTQNNDVIPEVISEVNTEVNVGPIVDTKRSKKLEQLSQARLSAKNKKRQRDEDLDYMKKKIDDLSSILLEQKKTKEESIQESIQEEEQNKRQRVTKEPEEESVPMQKDENEEETWSTSLIRTSAVLSLGAASWYMSNCYGKSTTKKQDGKKNIKKTKTPTSMLPYEVQRKHSVTVVGKSGFTK